MTKPIALFEYNKNSMSWSAGDCLQEARKDIEEYGKYNGVIFLAVDSKTGGYTTQFWNAGMSCSEVVALLEWIKYRMLKMIDDSEVK